MTDLNVGAIVGGVLGGLGLYLLVVGIVDRRHWMVLAGASCLGGFLASLLAMIGTR